MSHLRGYAIEHRGGVKRAARERFGGKPLATGDEPSALGDRVLDVPLDLVERELVDQRPDHHGVLISQADDPVAKAVIG
jgi:hypothetical protein